MKNQSLSKIITKNKEVLLFIAKAVGLYILYYVVYELWLRPNGFFDRLLIHLLTDTSAFILELFNYDVISSWDRLGISADRIVRVGIRCDAINLMILYAGFILCFKSKIKDKLIFIFSGVLVIHFLNVLRVLALALIYFYSPKSLEFNHKYTFTGLIYLAIFIMWMLWIKRIKNETKSN